MPRSAHSRLVGGSRLLVAAVVLLLLACTSGDPEPPATVEELRDRVRTALRGEGDDILHLQVRLPAVGGGFELNRETCVDWQTDTTRHAYYGEGSDEAPLTLIVDGRQYYPPELGSHEFSNDVGGLRLEPLELFVIPLLLLRFADETGTVTEAIVDGHRVWRLDQSGLSAEEDGEGIFCFDVILDFDARTELPHAMSWAECGDPRPASFLFEARLMDPHELPEGYFDPETAADFGGAP